MNEPDTAIVYFSPEAITHKGIRAITKKQVQKAFKRDDLMIFTEAEKLEQYLSSIEWKDKNLLMMSSGNFNNIKIQNLIK